MQIQMRVVVAIGAAYFIGYSRGMTASDNLGTQISEGLNKVGDGLTDIAVELGVEFKKYKEDKEEFGEKIFTDDNLSTEAKVLALAQRRDLFRSDDQIADFLDIQVEEVKIILGDDALEDIEGEESTDNAASAEIPGPKKVVYTGMSTRSEGAHPDHQTELSDPS